MTRTTDLIAEARAARLLADDLTRTARTLMKHASAANDEAEVARNRAYSLTEQAKRSAEVDVSREVLA